MPEIIQNEIGLFLFILLIMLALGQLLSSAVKKINLTEITGQLLAGIILGPTVFGYFNPHLYGSVFSNTNTTILIDNFFQLALIFTMFVAGFEVDLLALRNNKVTTLLVTLFGMLIPFAVGAAFGTYLGLEAVSVLFLGTAFAIAALPVIVKILQDAKLISTTVGTIVIASAVLTDIVGWICFGVITKSNDTPTLASLLSISFIFIAAISIIPRLLNTLRITITAWICVCLVFAIVCQQLHLHACLGAFLAGMALRKAVQQHESLKETLVSFVSSFFAPLFFVSIGLKVNFIANFNLSTVVTLFVLATTSKILGVFIGARLAGSEPKSSLLLSIILNARGAMEIVFASIALDLGIISSEIYVALVSMAFLTTIVSSLATKNLTANYNLHLLSQH